jgi:multidrug efflux pump subunit AcrA (membrane-fusion protein)
LFSCAFVVKKCSIYLTVNPKEYDTMSETSRWKQRKTWLWIGGVVAVIAIIALVATQRPFSQAQAQSAGTGDIVTVSSGDLAASATASGKVEAQRSARLALNGSGTVAQVFVDVGDSVQAGDPLLALETAELERAVANAEQTSLPSWPRRTQPISPPPRPPWPAPRLN